MTNAELKKKISEATEQEWFETISVTFDFPLTKQLSFTFTGLSAIYEFINQQINGWDKYENLPNELNQCSDYFNEIKYDKRTI